MQDLNEFLIESNAIEGVYDDDSLKQAQYAWDYLSKKKELTAGVVLKTHKILMLNQPLMPNEKGYFRTVPVYVGGEEKMEHSLLRDAVVTWAMRCNVNPKSWKECHVSYENIHPFVDGNGRTGRLFMNWQRLKAGLPILVIKESERYDYYDWFKEEK